MISMVFSDFLNEHFRYDDRISRKPFIVFTVLYWLLCFILPYLILILIAEHYFNIQISLISPEFSYVISSVVSLFASLFYFGFWLMCSVFIVCQSIRRLHDLNLTGGICFVYFLFFVFIITWGMLWLGILLLFQLILFILPGTEGENEYGGDPLKAFSNS